MYPRVVIGVLLATAAVGVSALAGPSEPFVSTGPLCVIQYYSYWNNGFCGGIPNSHSSDLTNVCQSEPNGGAPESSMLVVDQSGRLSYLQFNGDGCMGSPYQTSPMSPGTCEPSWGSQMSNMTCPSNTANAQLIQRMTYNNSDPGCSVWWGEDFDGLMGFCYFDGNQTAYTYSLSSDQSQIVFNNYGASPDCSKPIVSSAPWITLNSCENDPLDPGQENVIITVVPASSVLKRNGRDADADQ